MPDPSPETARPQQSAAAWKAILAAALCSALALPAAGADIDHAKNPNYIPDPRRGVVTKVVDADTVEVRLIAWLDQYAQPLYRIDGIDAPERNSDCPAERDAHARAMGRIMQLLGGEWTRAGTQASAPWVPAGDVWVTVLDSRHDKYGGRARGALLSETGQDVGAVLLSEGLAKPYGGGTRNPWCPALPARPPGVGAP